MEFGPSRLIGRAAALLIDMVLTHLLPVYVMEKGMESID